MATEFGSRPRYVERAPGIVSGETRDVFAPELQLRLLMSTLATMIESGLEIRADKIKTTAYLAFTALKYKTDRFDEAGLVETMMACESLQKSLKGTQLKAVRSEASKLSEQVAGEYDGKEIRISPEILRRVGANRNSGLRLAEAVGDHERIHKKHKDTTVEVPNTFTIADDKFTKTQLIEGKTHLLTRDKMPQKERAKCYEDMADRLERALGKAGINIEDLVKAFEENRLREFQTDIQAVHRLKHAA